MKPFEIHPNLSTNCTSFDVVAHALLLVVVVVVVRVHRVLVFGRHRPSSLSLWLLLVLLSLFLP
jgi:hypothetical protein